MVPTSDATPLRRLLRQPVFRRWAVANLFARLPLTMNLLALVLVGEEVTGSLATGATLAGIVTVTSGLCAQWRGGRLDRTELRAGMRADLLASAVVIGSLAVAAWLTAHVLVLAALAALLGVVSAAVLGGFRTLLIPSVPPEDIEAANALDAVFVEVAFVAGPAVAGILALAVGPIGVLGLMCLSFTIAALLSARLPTRHPVGEGRPPGPSPLRTHGATPVYALVFVLGIPLGAWEAAIPSRLADFGWQAASAGPLLALTALGSGIAGIIAANRPDPLRRGRVIAGVLMLAFGILMLPSAFAGSILVLGIVLFLFGLPIAPLNALAGLSFQRIIAVPRQAEGFSLYPAMLLIGAGSGQALAGAVLERVGASAVITAASAIPFVLGLVVLGAAARRRALGMPPGVGFGHDPSIADPASYTTDDVSGRPLQPASGHPVAPAAERHGPHDVSGSHDPR